MNKSISARDLRYWIGELQMKIKEIQNGILLEGVNDFDATHIFECGQCFRWSKEDDGSYTGVAYGKVINVLSDYEKSQVIINNTNAEDFQNIWYDYFDLGRDYGELKRKLSEDSVMDMAIKHGKGIRILQQEPWETVISYIISANNNIPRIAKSINLLSEFYGQPLEYAGAGQALDASTSITQQSLFTQKKLTLTVLNKWTQKVLENIS
jgi:N-glycosylase/DNA lyase